MSKCIVCHERPAAVPDRNTMSLRKRVCRECHAARLTGDLRHVLEVHAKSALDRKGVLPSED